MHFSIPEFATPSREDHRQILNLIKTGDDDQAKECLRSHIAYTTRLFDAGFAEKDT
jgi:DNA-binding FadR family transcriptional regulator